MMRFARRYLALLIAISTVACSTAVPSAAVAAETACSAKEDAMQKIVELAGSEFPAGGTLASGSSAPTPVPTPKPMFKLRIATVDVSAIDGTCKKATSIRVKLRVAALNTGRSSTFIIQNAKVVCGLFVKNDNDEVASASAFKGKNFKLSTLTFRFLFDNVRDGEEALSVLFTGDKDDPGSGFTPEGEATTDSFVPHAQLGGCTVRINA
jgi:hypothetical protein